MISRRAFLVGSIGLLLTSVVRASDDESNLRRFNEMVKEWNGYVKKADEENKFGIRWRETCERDNPRYIYSEERVTLCKEIENSNLKQNEHMRRLAKLERG